MSTGAEVIACARTVGRLEDLDDAIKSAGGLPATLVPFDCADMAETDTLGGAINEHWGKLDILVANANVLGAISPVGHVKAKVFEKVMTVNVAMRAQAILGEDSSTVPHPSEVAAKLLPLVGPDQTETGKLFIIRENRIVDYRLPD